MTSASRIPVHCPICGRPHYAQHCPNRAPRSRSASVQFVTAWADWNGRTVIKAAVYGVAAEPIEVSMTVDACDDAAVKTFAESRLAELGLELASAWTVAPDPAGRAGDRRLVFIAGIRPVGGPVPCQRPGVDPDAWYPLTDRADASQSEPSPERARELEALAAELCAGCPLREQCLADGLSEEFGVWGGEAPHQRRARRRLQREMERAA